MYFRQTSAFCQLRPNAGGCQKAAQGAAPRFLKKAHAPILEIFSAQAGGLKVKARVYDLLP